MTTSSTTLGQIFDSVEVTPGQGAQILAALASDMRDGSPELYTVLMSASSDLLNPPVRSSTSGTSSTSKSA